jgi:CRISPR-associated protein Csh1
LTGEIINIQNIDKKSDQSVGLKEFKERDYLSKLISMNKPIDNKKVIHSNNYLCFWIKKDSLKPDLNGKIKLSTEILDNYYNVLENPRLKYKGKSLELYEAFEEQNKEPDIKNIESCKTWIKKHILNLINDEAISQDKNYLKVFFQYDLDLYNVESLRYTLVNIFNSTDFNVLINNEIHGLPNDNMGMNAKKPYLENKSRIKNKVPYLLSTNDVYMQKKFFDYLLNFVNQGKYNIYFNSDDDDAIKIYPYANAFNHNKKMSGYFLRIQKGMELMIQDYDLITGFSSDIEPFMLEQVIPVAAHSDLIYEKYTELGKIQKTINEIFFKKFLINNYFTEAGDIKLNDFRVKEELLRCRNSFFSWFYKGESKVIKNLFPDSSLELIKNSIINNSFSRAIDQFNVREAFISYFEGGKNMADQLTQVRESLRTKINMEGIQPFENDLEYFYGVGQLSNYYISKNKTTKLNHSLVNPILNCRTDEQMKELLKRFFVKYNYDIKPGRRFDHLQSMIFSYTPESPMDTTTLIAGYLSPNLIYESKKNQSEEIK